MKLNPEELEYLWNMTRHDYEVNPLRNSECEWRIRLAEKILKILIEEKNIIRTNKHDCQCEYCKDHLCIIGNRNGRMICVDKNCENNKEEK